MITSTNFGEPTATKLLQKREKAVAVHGERGSEELVYVGGRGEEVRRHIERWLTQLAQLVVAWRELL